MMHISKNSVVSFRYIMKNGRGEILEDIVNNDPVSYLHGSTGILPLLQAQLEGLKTGDKKVVCLAATSGLTNEDFIFEVVIDAIRAASKEEVLLGYPLNINETKCEGGCDCYSAQVRN